MEKTAIVTNIQGYSIHDGPGIRTVVFFKGCPLSCQWCANPENIDTSTEIGFIAKLCQGCGRCFLACQNGALNPDASEPRIIREKCVACGKCVEACYYKALVRYGEEMSVDEVFDKVRRDKMFYEDGGGVTVSGGEPLMFAEFVRDLFELCKKDDISTCIETSGFATEEKCRLLLPFTDHFLFDLKQINSIIHEKYTGLPNEQILSNARFLVENGADVLFRIPLIPGVNDDPLSTREFAEFAKSAGNPRVQLMPFHRIGQSKYQALGESYLFEQVEVMEKEVINSVVQVYLDSGVDCTVSR